MKPAIIKISLTFLFLNLSSQSFAVFNMTEQTRDVLEKLKNIANNISEYEKQADNSSADMLTTEQKLEKTVSKRVAHEENWLRTRHALKNALSQGGGMETDVVRTLRADLRELERMVSSAKVHEGHLQSELAQLVKDKIRFNNMHTSEIRRWTAALPDLPSEIQAGIRSIFKAEKPFPTKTSFSKVLSYLADALHGYYGKTFTILAMLGIGGSAVVAALPARSESYSEEELLPTPAALTEFEKNRKNKAPSHDPLELKPNPKAN